MLEVCDIQKSYQGQRLLDGVTFEVAAGETVCLLGSSGSGKSTLLRIITGLETLEGGEVFWQGENMADVPVHKRNFGLMFQDYALFPHRDVAQNVAFGLRMQGLTKSEIDQRVEQALMQVNMAPFLHRRVTELSGGEQQRVALARALAPRPRLLMLDEPLGALDHNLREQLIGELRQLLHTTGIPAIYVTHDQEEAFAIADRLVLLNDGKVAQMGMPYDIYHHPKSAWVARFLGLGGLLPAEVVGGEQPGLQTAVGFFAVVEGLESLTGKQGTVLFRSTGARIVGDENEPGNILKGIVEDVVFNGERYRIQLQCERNHCLEFLLDEAPAVGKQLSLAIPSQSIVFFSDESHQELEKQVCL